MKKNYLRILIENTAAVELFEVLKSTPYDMFFKISLPQNRYQSIYQAPGKYYAPLQNGVYSSLCQFVSASCTHPDDAQKAADLLNPETLAERLVSAVPKGILSEELRYQTPDGEWRWTLQILIGGEQYGLMPGTVYSFSYDMQRQEDERIISLDTAARDEVTGLYKDRDFLHRAAALQREGQWCMLNADIGHFKLLQSWSGTATGSRLLAKFGEIFRRTARETGGYAGYRGQDVFAMLMPCELPRIERLYEELQEAISSTVTAVGFLPAIGVCILGDDTEMLESLNRASIACEEAKANLTERVRFYDSKNDLKYIRELTLVNDFLKAIRSGEIDFYLQPQCRVSTRRIIGSEALARWRRADGSFVSPAVFVPVLEQYGVVTNLDKFIWESVCAWLAGLRSRGIRPVPVSVNVSRIDILTIDVPAFLLSLLEKYALDVETVKIEITESAYAEDMQAVQDAVRRLREAGFQVLMDDFGSGFSSLNMLKSVNMDVIKLDAGFLHMQEREMHKGVSILESVINMTKNISMPLIAEGVENEKQAHFLVDQGCRYMQGYYFYKPMPKEDFEALIKNKANVEYSGIRFKANQEMHVREFLDQNVFTDTMLNNILGPVAFYLQNGDNVDITRFNQQFYQMVGLDAEVLAQRLQHIQTFFYPDDAPRFLSLLDQAVADPVNGAVDEFRLFKPNGSIMWISAQVYFMGEDENGRRFYGSTHDITERQFFNLELPGAYFRCTDTPEYELLYMSANFLRLTGYSRDELQSLFTGSYAAMVHPDDLPTLYAEIEQVRAGTLEQPSPYRIRQREQGYVYVTERCYLKESFGQPCWQSVLISVDSSVKTQKHLELLSKNVSFAFVFVRPDGESLSFEVVIYGLEKALGLDRAAFEKALNSGLLDGGEPGSFRRRLLEHLENPSALDDFYTLSPGGGTPQSFRINFDAVRNAKEDVICILNVHVT